MVNQKLFIIKATWKLFYNLVSDNIKKSGKCSTLIIKNNHEKTKHTHCDFNLCRADIFGNFLF